MALKSKEWFLGRAKPPTRIKPSAFLDEWVKAVNEHGGFGRWVWAVSRRPGDVVQILEQASSARSIANGNGHSL